jgi:hypothetical protein
MHNGSRSFLERGTTAPSSFPSANPALLRTAQLSKYVPSQPISAATSNDNKVMQAPC